MHQFESLSVPKKHKSEDKKSEIPAKKKKISEDASKNIPIRRLSSPELNVGEREAGTIQRILLLNFMCHSKLEVSFSPHINIITGRNGSGKSAVLNAIILALGGKSIDTDRGNNVKEFIQYGKKSSSIYLTLRNVGPGAYKPKEYGDKITIVRYFKADGTGGYRIINSWGKTVSTKKKELLCVESHLNIQVDNPLALMNQEVSKTFLNSKNPKDKYELFMKATMLKQIEKHYNSAVEDKQSAIEILQKKLMELSDLRKTIISLNKKLGSYKTMNDLRLKLKNLKVESAWAQIALQENDCKDMISSLAKQSNKIEELNEQICQINAEMNDKEKVLKENKSWMNTIQDHYSTVSEKLKSVEQEAFILQKEFETKCCLLETINREMKSTREDIAQSENTLKGVLSKYSKHGSSDKESIQRKIAELPRKICHLKREIEARQEMANTVYRRMKELQETFNSLEFEKKSVLSEMGAYKQKLKLLKSVRKDNISVYGHWMPVLLNKIEDNYAKGYFKFKPIGPLGAHIFVKDVKWRLAVETNLSSLLSAFCVDNVSDCKLLQQLIRDTCGVNAHKCSVLMSRFTSKVYDVSKYAVRTHSFQSMIDILEVDDVNVMNCLIDHRRIETVLLFDKVEEACFVLSQHKRVPRGCTLGFTAGGYKVHPDPNFRVYCCAKNRAEYLGISVDSNVEQWERELCEMESRKLNIDRTLQSITDELKPLKQESSSYIHEIELFETRIKSLQSQFDQLNEIDIPYLSQTTCPLDSEISALNERLADLEHKQSKLEIDVDIVRDKKQELINQANMLKLQLEKVKNKEFFLHSQVNEHKELIGRLKETKSLRLAQLKSLEERYMEMKKKYEAANKTLNTYLDKIQSNSEFSKKVITQRSPEAIENEILKVMKMIENLSRINTINAKEELIKRLNGLKQKYGDLETLADKTNKLLQKLNSMVTKRGEFYKLYKSMIGLHVKFTFNSIMSNKQFDGDIEIDHEARTLNILLSHHGGKVSKDVKSLSGGERSVSTVCLILALWGVIGSPFRILDEFDVFMDMVNRSACIKMLIEKSKSLSGRQFIFISPQDMSELNAYIESKKINVYRMQDPVR